MTDVVNDRVKVSLNAKFLGFSDAENNKYTFHFPTTIPRTYATLDYGRFIHDFKIRTKPIHGSNQLQINKIGKNVPINLQEGDLVELFSSRWLNEYDEPKEGSIFNLNVVRDGQSMTIP